MAKYGYNKYGSGFKFGETSAVSVYYNSQIIAWPIDYDTVSLYWNNIVPNPTDPYPTHWKLVKSYTGSLDNPDDGTTVVGGPFSSFSTYYTDVTPDSAASEVSYSIWVFNGNTWINCGSDYTVVVDDKDSLTNLTSWLPKAWLNPVNLVGEALGEPNASSFITTLGVYSFIYDKLRAEANLLSVFNDYSSAPMATIRPRVSDLGFTLEPALGDSYHRSLFASGNIINAYKGTSLSVSTYTTALTHFGNDIQIGHNLMLDYNDSSFEESIGRWKQSAGTFVSEKYTGSGLSAPTTSILVDRVYAPRAVGHAKFTTTAMTARTLTLPDPALDVTTNGIPVKERTRYVFSGWVLHQNNSATVKVKINWYNRFGTLIGTTIDGASLTTTTSWQEFVSASDSGRNGKESPKGAVYAGIVVTVTPTVSATNNYIFDFFQLSEAAKSFEYEDARKINTIITGNKVNYMPNSSFDDSTSFWSGINGVLNKDRTNSSGVLFGSSSAKLVSNASGVAGYTSDWVKVAPNTVVSFSAYVIGSAATPAVARIEFSNYLSSDKQVAVLTDIDGTYFPTDDKFIDSDPITLTPFRQKVSVSTTVPPITKDSGDTYVKVNVFFPENQASDTYWLDSVMLQTSLNTDTYFSGSGGVFPSNPVTETFYKKDDCHWGVENIFNYVSNPSFENSTNEWTASSGTLTSVSTDGAYTPLYGTKFGKLSYTTSGEVTFTAYLPTAALGGEDFIGSVYVRKAVATYTIEGSTYTIDSGNATEWVRISGIKQLTQGQTSVTFTVGVTNTSGSTSTIAHFDGAQGEYGRLVSKFVDPSNAVTTVSLNNPLTSGKIIYASQDENTNATAGNYAYNYSIKSSRLSSSLGLVTPTGATWAVKTGGFVDQYSDPITSLVPASSFENSLYGWTTNSSTISRIIAGGSLLGDVTTQGQAYARVVTAGTAGSSSFGITSGKAYLTPDGGFYAAVAIRPKTSSSYGDYTLTVDFYDANDSLVQVYIDDTTHVYTTSSVDAFGTPNVLVTNTARSVTKSISHTDRWAYIANTFSAGSVAGASYAKVTVTCAPTAFSAGQAFDVDRVVFRQ